MDLALADLETEVRRLKRVEQAALAVVKSFSNSIDYNTWDAALDALEAARPDPARLDIGVITAGIAVTWIGFRHPGFDFAAGRPGLVALQAALETRPSFAATRPG